MRRRVKADGVSSSGRVRGKIQRMVRLQGCDLEMKLAVWPQEKRTTHLLQPAICQCTYKVAQTTLLRNDGHFYKHA